MKILFLTIGNMSNMDEHTIYTDLLRCFQGHGHDVYVVSCEERRNNKPTSFSSSHGIHVLNVKTGNMRSCGFIEKGISTILIEYQYIVAIKKYLSEIKFDLILYSTPPITFSKIVKFLKKRDGAKTYLLLKDIFPQNAVDIGVLSKHGLKSLIYNYFRKKEEQTYEISDYIGCMSPANVDYIVKNNKLDSNKVEVCPNSIEVFDKSINVKERNAIREKYNLPLDKRIFVYGGNLGKPQGIEHLLKCLKSQQMNDKIYFLVVGGGTEYKKIETFLDREKIENVKLMMRLPKSDYDNMVGACDVGMIFLDKRFTIPNFPSRLISYMQAQIPVLAVTDRNTDVGKIITNNGFGWWCDSSDVLAFEKIIQVIQEENLSEKGKLGYECLERDYSVANSYNIIMQHF